MFENYFTAPTAKSIQTKKNSVDSWLDKYKPTNLDDVIGNKETFLKLDTFIKSFTKNVSCKEKILNPNVIVIGPNGVGKSLVVEMILKDNDYNKLKINLSSISVKKKQKRKSNKSDKDALNNIKSVTSYYQTLLSKKIGQSTSSKYAIVFDDISNIFAAKEKEVMKALIKLNNKHKNFPIIIISNDKHSKLVNELKKLLTYSVKKKKPEGKKKNDKIINEILIPKPATFQLVPFIEKIAGKEGMKFAKAKTMADDCLEEIADHSQCDIRRLVNILEELKLLYPNKIITFNDITDYIQISKTKDIDPGIYEATQSLLNNYSGIEKSLIMYSEERATIPLMVHENYPSNIKTQYSEMPVEKQLDLLYEISKNLSESDRVDGLIYSNQCWNLQTVHGFYSCVMPSFYINKHPNKMSTKEYYSFTKDYNRSSIKKINNKVIKKAQEHPMFKRINVTGFLYISLILKSLIIQKNFEEFAELMKPYGLKLKEIESIIKIDKIKKQEKQLTGKQKNILKELLDVDE